MKDRYLTKFMQGKKLLQQGIDDLKLVTRRYAKKQDKWVMNRLIRRGDRQVIHLPRFIINDIRVHTVINNLIEIIQSILIA